MTEPTVSFPGKTPVDVIAASRWELVKAGSVHADFEYAYDGGIQISFTGSADLAFPSSDPASAREMVTEDLPDYGLGSIGRVDWIVDGGSTYVRAAWLRSLGAHTAWVRLAKTLGPRMTRALGILVSQQNDPAQVMYLLSHVTQAHEVGTQMIGSTFTAHLTGHVDVRQLQDALPGQTSGIREGFDTLLQRLNRSGYSDLPFEAWIDANGNLVELRYSYPLAAATGTLHGKLTLTFSFSGLGDAVQIAVPPADQVTDSSKLG
ncbi:MAG: hypothetical protein ACXVEI_11850 [Actinomycetota bacterium]